MAEELGPGVYFGYFNVDRWGQRVFHNGPYHIFVSNEVEKQLKIHVGEPLKLDVKEVYQPGDPGGGIIKTLSGVSTTKIQGLVLDVASESTKSPQGKGISLRLTVHNASAKDITLEPRSLAFVLVTKSPFSNAAIDYKDPDGCAYWYYRTSVRSARRNGSLLRVACRRVLLPWTPQKYAANGQDVVVGRRTPTHLDPGVYYPLHVKPGGKFETTVVVGRKLLPGEYEVFFYQSSGNFSHAAGPMSKRLPFEVVEF
jgi:hypothetical protein